MEPVQNRRLRYSCVRQYSAQTRATVGESGHFGGVGPAQSFEGSPDQSGEIGLGPGNCAKPPAATVSRLDVANANLQVTFAAFAAAYEGRVQTDGECRGSRRLPCRRIGEPL